MDTLVSAVFRTHVRCCVLALCLSCLGFLTGCGDRPYYPVKGKILDKSGQVIEGLAGAQVEFESAAAGTSSVGEIKEDGSFELTTESPGDGASPGPSRVLIARKYLEPALPVPRVIDSKYERFETSTLEFNVEKKSDNYAEFRVERFQPSASQPVERVRANR